MSVRPLILIATHAPRGARNGNRITALRWAAFLRSAKYRVKLINQYRGEKAVMMIALHAQRTRVMQDAFVAANIGVLLVALTGTDIYGDWPNQQEQMFAERCITAIIAFTQDMKERLPKSLQNKTNVLMQSAKVKTTAKAQSGEMRFLVSGHLREVKAPFVPVQSLHRLPPRFPVQLDHLGGVITEAYDTQAIQWMKQEPRYHYRGEVSHRAALDALSHAHVLINPSVQEGCPAVVIEAVVSVTPILASDIPAHRAILGESYPGLFPVGDVAALSALMQKMVAEPSFYLRLQHWVGDIAARFSPEHERIHFLEIVKNAIEQRGEHA